eukprot:CAMPEP_0172475002 /NCGR_PEP_ID=MMETSP1065-20121228/69646_1 /TAXON_ID=265537 /ORGANISM="Amphiprora paludosa, Strain CCMP125" /LENGTH=321 /DNA_ID=CAMNT_0013233195 /DNA_START=62 /DNA_END=1027 /DNA_ORIENTATION=+
MERAKDTSTAGLDQPVSAGGKIHDASSCIQQHPESKGLSMTSSTRKSAEKRSPTAHHAGVQASSIRQKHKTKKRQNKKSKHTPPEVEPTNSVCDVAVAHQQTVKAQCTGGEISPNSKNNNNKNAPNPKKGASHHLLTREPKASPEPTFNRNGPTTMIPNPPPPNNNHHNTNPGNAYYSPPGAFSIPGIRRRPEEDHWDEETTDPETSSSTSRMEQGHCYRTEGPEESEELPTIHATLVNDNDEERAPAPSMLDRKQERRRRILWITAIAIFLMLVAVLVSLLLLWTSRRHADKGNDSSRNDFNSTIAKNQTKHETPTDLFD